MGVLAGGAIVSSTPTALSRPRPGDDPAAWKYFTGSLRHELPAKLPWSGQRATIETPSPNRPPARKRQRTRRIMILRRSDPKPPWRRPRSNCTSWYMRGNRCRSCEIVALFTWPDDHRKVVRFSKTPGVVWIACCQRACCFRTVCNRRSQWVNHAVPVKRSASRQISRCWSRPFKAQLNAAEGVAGLVSDGCATSATCCSAIPLATARRRRWVWLQSRKPTISTSTICNTEVFVATPGLQADGSCIPQQMRWKNLRHRAAYTHTATGPYTLGNLLLAS